ncbi:MAG TPA: hypothetical protein PLU95_03600 [Syntrophales bacterium]|nr:hypothetical protein [Syntrophales bacterium]
MANTKKRIDTSQLSLFDTLKSYQSQPEKKPAGSFDIDRTFREAISEALKRCPRSRWEVAGRMSELTGQEITKSMLDSYTAESKEQHRFPAIFLPAFCEAVGCSEPLKLLGRLVGVFVLPGPEALRAEIQRIEEEIAKKSAEKRKRMMFLKEMEAER